MQPGFLLPIEQGVSFDQTLNWYGGGKFIAPIEDLRPGYPTEIRVSGHGLNSLSPTPIIISGVLAKDQDDKRSEMRHINSEDTGIPMATYVDANWFTVDLSTVDDEWFEGTGEITYWKPSDIDGWGGECNIRKNWHSPILHTISTELGTMTLDGTDGSIRLQISPVDTSAFTFVNGVYDIDLWPGGGSRPDDGSTIIRVFKGPVKLGRDI